MAIGPATIYGSGDLAAMVRIRLEGLEKGKGKLFKKR